MTICNFRNPEEIIQWWVDFTPKHTDCRGCTRKSLPWWLKSNPKSCDGHVSCVGWDGGLCEKTKCTRTYLPCDCDWKTTTKVVMITSPVWVGMGVGVRRQIVLEPIYLVIVIEKQPQKLWWSRLLCEKTIRQRLNNCCAWISGSRRGNINCTPSFSHENYRTWMLMNKWESESIQFILFHTDVQTANRRNPFQTGKLCCVNIL